MKPLSRLTARVHPRLAVVSHDLIMVWLAWYFTHLLRFSIIPDPPPVALLPDELPWVLVAQSVVLWWTGLYRGLWRFASLPDLWNIVRAGVIGALAISLALFLFNRLEGVPRAVLVLYPGMLVLLLGAPRMLYRFWKDSRFLAQRAQPATRVLVLGAGRAGEGLVRDLKRDNRYRPVGFLDDKRDLRGARLHGLPVLGVLEDLPRIASEVAAQMLLIAMPGAGNQQMQRVVELCESSGLPFRTVPRLQDVVDGRFEFNELKEVAIEDLLGREPVALDWDAIRTALAGRRVLITGGGGSIGAELCRQVARLGVESLTVLELSEYNLYRIEQELRGEFPDLLLRCVLGDCGDASTCEYVLGLALPDAVFHAAAFKQVPLLQAQVREAFRNNVLATQTLALACQRRRVESFVLISSDKAVNPSNVMGATKRIAELVCQSIARNGPTRFVTVRFGNVLDSAGSVVPLFREQIQRGGPVTVTHPEVTRYFMTITESCQLILQSLSLGNSGEILALDMGQPVRIRYLAEQMIRLAGKTPERDVAIVYTGLRPGEKLFEELFHEQERYQPTAHPKIMLAEHRVAVSGDLDRDLHDARQAVLRFDERALRRMLHDLVPEFADGDVDAKVVSISNQRRS